MSCAVYKVRVKLTRCISDAASNSSIAHSLNELNNAFLGLQPYLEHAELLRAQTSENQQLLNWILKIRKLSNDIEKVVDIYCCFQSSDRESRFFSSATITSSPVEFILNGCSQITSFPNSFSFVVWRKFLINFSKKVVKFHLPKIIGKARELHLNPNALPRDPSSLNSRKKHIGLGEFNGLIGRKKEVKAIKELMTQSQRNSEKNVEIVAVEGIGGIGKTTIAKEVFNDVKGEFDCYAWVVFSQQNTTAVTFLKDVIKGLFDSLSLIGPRNLKDISFVDPLKETIRRCLDGKNFLLVIDDISSHQDISPSFLLNAFPQDSRGKILLTSRGIDDQKEYNHVYTVEALNSQDSLDLLRRSCNTDDNLWHHVESIAEEITKMCQYVPLSIKTIGGLLSSKIEVSQWIDIRERLKKYYLLPLCYTEMQPALKTCFLYSSLFEDKVEFSSKMLQRMWIAEGLIEPEPDLSLEDTAKLRMDDLIQRNFLQVVRAGIDGETKTCSLLRPIREFATQRCVEDRFNTIVASKSNSLFSFDNYSLLLTFYLSEFILYGCSQITSLFLSVKHLINILMDEVESHVPDIISGSSINLRRMHNGVGEFDRLIRPAKEVKAVRDFITPRKSTKNVEIMAINLNGYNYHQILRSCKTGFKPLAVLELRHLTINSLPDIFGNLILLKYLGLRGSKKLKTLPKSIGKLRKLETLDIRETMIVELPKEMETLIKLRHLLLSGSFTDRVVSLLFNIDISLDIITIAGVKLTKEMVKRLCFLSRVRKLSVGEVCCELSEDLLESVYEMDCLESLTIKCAVGKLFYISETQNPPTSLLKLRLGGQVKGLHHWNSKLNALKYLYLWDTQLEEDPFSLLKHLKNIMVLSLCNVYNGERIEVEEGDFPELKKLSIICFDGLKEWGEIKKGVLERLEELTFSNCWKLEAIPMGLENLSRLKTLHCTNMPICFVKEANVLYGQENKTLKRMELEITNLDQ